MIRVQREVEIRNAGFVTVNDTLTLEVPQGAQVQITSLKMGTPSPFTSVRRYFYVLLNGEWQPLHYQETNLGVTGFDGYELELPSPVTLGGGQTLQILTSYLFVDLVSGAGNDYSVQIPVFPALPHNISSFVVQVTLPDYAMLRAVDSPLAFTNFTMEGTWTLRHEAEMLAPMMNENLTIIYRPAPGDEYLLDCELMRREISVKPGRLRAEDSYFVANMGTEFSFLYLSLPSQASEIKARDSVGPLKATYEAAEEGEDHIHLRVDPRKAITQGEKWGFTVEYLLPSGGHIDGRGGRFTLTNPPNGLDHYIRRLVLVTALPEGGSLITSTPEHTFLMKTSALSQEVTIEILGVMPSETRSLTIEYGWSPIWSILRPAAWGLLVAGIAASVYLLRQRGIVAKEEPKEAVRPILEDFLSLYRERVALLVEQDSLEDGLSRREIGREEFDRRITEITRHQRELLQTLRQLEDRLGAAQPEREERLKAIKIAESELERVDADLNSLEVRLRARRISRQDYSRRRRDISRRRSRALRRIEQLIAGLQAEA